MKIEWDFATAEGQLAKIAATEKKHKSDLVGYIRGLMTKAHAVQSSAKSQEEFMSKAEDKSEAALNLPHPARCNYIEHEVLCCLSLSPDIIYGVRLAALAALPIPEAIKFCELHGKDKERLDNLKNHSLDQATGANSGQLVTALTPVYQNTLNSPTFVFDSNLIKELSLTDISKGVMADMFQPPYESMYVAFGDNEPPEGHFVYNSSTKDHALEGVYINITSEPRKPYGDGLEILGLHSKSELLCVDVMFIGKPKSNIMDDATQNASFFFDLNSDISLIEQIDKNLEYYSKITTFNTEESIDSFGNEYKILDGKQSSNMKDNLTLLVKCLVYLNCADVRKEVVNNRADLEKKAKGVKNPKKLKRLQKEIDRSHAYTIISGSDPLPNTESQGGSRSGVKPHWRRGFLRTQKHGKGRTLSRLVHIKPTLVNKSKLGKESTPKATYKVK